MGKLMTQCVFIFSLTFCLTYLIASTSYKNSIYVYKFEGIDDEIEKYVCISCFITTVLAVIGSVFVEYGVTHIFCAFTICIPLGLVVPGMSGYSLYNLRIAEKYDEETIRQAVEGHWETSSAVVPFLAAIQRDQECCGLYSPMDYRDFIYDKACEGILHDVPDSCVDLRNLFDKCVSARGQKDFCYVYNFTHDAIMFKDGAVHNLVHNMTLQERTKYKCTHVNGTNANVNNLGIRMGIVFSEGCMEYIIGNSQTLRDAHYFFFFLIVIFAWTIVISFLKIWYKNVQKARREYEAEENDELKSQVKTIGYVTEN